MAMEGVSTQEESTPGDDLSQIMEAALEAFEQGFEIRRDQTDTSPLAGDCTTRSALLSCQREELYE